MISRLEDFKTYNLAMELGENVWKMVSTWGYLERDTISKQLVRAVDSIAANLSEDLEDIIIKNPKTLVISPGDLYLKQKHGLQKPAPVALYRLNNLKKLKSGN